MIHPGDIIDARVSATLEAKAVTVDRAFTGSTGKRWVVVNMGDSLRRALEADCRLVTPASGQTVLHPGRKGYRD